MKTITILASCAAVLLAISVAAWQTYESNDYLEAPHTSILDGLEGRHAAAVKFENAAFGDCIVQHAWIQKGISVSWRQVFGIDFDERRQDVAFVHVLVRSKEEAKAPDLALIDKTTRSWFFGGAGSWIEMDTGRVWLTTTQSDYPTPETLEFSCGNAIMKASVLPTRDG